MVTPSKPRGPKPVPDEYLFGVISPDVRGRWPDENLNLTPWVIENLDQLSTLLGMELEFVDREVPLGRFRADIVARDEFGRTVVIENQFGPSDHKHFGQIVLYACEARADVVVWLIAGTCKPRVMTPFRSQHRHALNRLNSVFAGATDFFGVQLTLESDPQPASAPTLPISPRLSIVVSVNRRPTQQS